MVGGFDGEGFNLIVKMIVFVGVIIDVVVFVVKLFGD